MLVYKMNKDKRFLNALDDWGTILTDTYERNAAEGLTIEGNNLPIAIVYKDEGIQKTYMVPEGINTINISKIYNDLKFDTQSEGKFVKIESFGRTLIMFYVRYDDMLLNDKPALEFISNVFAENPQKYKQPEIKNHYLVITLVQEDGDTFVLDNGSYGTTGGEAIVTIDPKLKNRMLEDE